MKDIPELKNWTIVMGGNRVGANVSLRASEPGAVAADICGTVKGWLDADGKPATRKNATFCLIRRWSYGIGGGQVPDWFSVRLNQQPPRYNSKTFRPAE